MTPGVDMVVTRSGELEVAQIEGQNGDADEFIDAFLSSRNPGSITAVDSGRIIIPSRDLDEFLAKAAFDGFKIEEVKGL